MFQTILLVVKGQGQEVGEDRGGVSVDKVEEIG